MKLNSSSMVETLSTAQREQLAAYEELLRARALPLGLIAEGDGDRLRERHISDSLRAIDCLAPEDRRLVDLGSGAGLPGIPLAVSEPRREVILVERKARAAAFLELASEELGLTNVEVINRSIETVRLEDADVALARALAPPDRAWCLAVTLLAPRGRLVYWAGRRWRESLTEGDHSAVVRICAPPLFSWQGPLVIMRRRPSPPLEERNDGH